jgi:hypothetical protein
MGPGRKVCVHIFLASPCYNQDCALNPRFGLHECSGKCTGEKCQANKVVGVYLTLVRDFVVESVLEVDWL